MYRINSEKKWCVVYTYPNAEKKLYNRLLEKGVEVFLPTQKAIRFWSDRKKTIEVPLFNSYVFTKVDNRSIETVRRTQGFASFVQFMGQPAVIPDDQIETIRMMVEGKAPVEVQPYTKGEQVKIKEGPLKGRKGTVIRSNGKHQVAIEISHVGYALVVEVDQRDTVPVKKV